VFGPERIYAVIQGLIILILSIAVHEFGHAFVADRLGDRLPRSQGRVTLNPIAHADPLGTLLLPTMFLALTGGYGFGWGKPVQVNPVAFTRKLEMRTGHMLVALAGPMMNILLGTILAIVLVALSASGTISDSSALGQGLERAVVINFILAFFNLVPAPPLDGGAVLEGFLPRSALSGWHQVKVYGPFVLLALIMIPGASKVFVDPAIWVTNKLFALLVTLFGLAP
jgi:Zn-dependent protease